MSAQATIQPIQYSEIPAELLKQARKENRICGNSAKTVWYGAFVNGSIVGAMGLTETKSEVSIRCLFGGPYAPLVKAAKRLAKEQGKAIAMLEYKQNVPMLQKLGFTNQGSYAMSSGEVFKMKFAVV